MAKEKMIIQLPQGRKRKEKIAINKERIIQAEQEGFRPKQYDLLDSRLDGGARGEMRKSFVHYLEFGESLQDFIKRCLKECYGEAVAVEFGGIGIEAFRHLLEEGFLKRSLAVTLVDYRKDYQKAQQPQNHEVLVGDITSSDFYKKLERSLGGAKPDLIIERMAGGVEYIPPDPYEVYNIMNIWYKMLNTGGMMLVQTPIVFNDVLAEWAVQLQKYMFKKTLSFRHFEGTKDDDIHCSSFLLRKFEGAPEDLPMLDRSALRKLKKF